VRPGCGVVPVHHGTDPAGCHGNGCLHLAGHLGVLSSKQVYAGLSNSTVVLFGGMFVIGAAMFKTGLAQAIGEAVVRKAGTEKSA